MTTAHDRYLLEGSDSGFNPVTCEGCDCKSEPDEFLDTIYGERCLDCAKDMKKCGECEAYCEPLDMDNGLCPDCEKLRAEEAKPSV